MNRTTVRNALSQTPTDEAVTLGGWIRTVRTSKGGFSFLSINDGSCMACIQIVADNTLANYNDEIVHLTAGCSIVATGKLVASQGKGQQVEMQAADVRILGKSDADHYPIQPKHHSFEFLRTQAHLRARTNTFGAVARVRSAMSRIIHDYFQSRDFLYMHTPLITASDCEGAGQMFRVTTLDDLKDDPDNDFFGRPTYLTVSGQLEAETYACGLGNIYTFGPTFRAENSNTPRHLAEFWMVEPEIAFCDLQGDADLAEDFLKSLFASVLNECSEDMEFFNLRIDKTVIETLEHIANSPFERVTYTEAIDLLLAADKKWQFPVEWGCDLQTEHERYLAEEKFCKPVIITDYPACIKPFYMRVNDDEKTVAAMDVLVPKIGEIIGGSQREERLDVLQGRMEHTGLAEEDYWWYTDLRRYGTVPHAGFGLGFERAIQFVTGMANIRDVIPYPRTPRSADF